MSNLFAHITTVALTLRVDEFVFTLDCVDHTPDNLFGYNDAVVNRELGDTGNELRLRKAKSGEVFDVTILGTKYRLRVLHILLTKGAH